MPLPVVIPSSVPFQSSASVSRSMELYVASRFGDVQLDFRPVVLVWVAKQQGWGSEEAAVKEKGIFDRHHDAIRNVDIPVRRRRHRGCRHARASAR